MSKCAKVDANEKKSGKEVMEKVKLRSDDGTNAF